MSCLGRFRAALLVAAAVLPSAARAGQLPASAFQTYNAASVSTIVPGPFSLYTVSVNQLQPTQMNEGFTEVNTKTTGFDITQPSQLGASLVGDIEPVVIGPGGTLYLTDGHHTFTALEDSSYGASNPTVYVNVIANYSNLTPAQFWAQMQASDLLLPLNDGVPETINPTTGAPIPTSLQGLNQDVYRGLEYSILKNKNSKLFPNTSNISGASGSTIPGIDKETGLYSDFINADAYRNAVTSTGVGLPYLSPGDIQLATQWNLNPNSVTSEPNVGTVKVGQLPGSILNGNIIITGTISNTTLANGTLAGTTTGTFDEATTFASFNGITQFNLGTPSNPILVGQAQSGFVMQLGNDSGFSVTLSGTNTYTGGTTITAGDLIIGSDAALGALPTLSTAQFNSSLTLNSLGFPTNALTAVEADNGIIFNSLTEGNGTLTIGTTPGGGTQTFTTNRPIAIDSEAATINVNGYVLTLGGPLVSAGTNDVALGNADGEANITIDDNSANLGKLILSTASPNFYGNIIIGNANAPTVEVMSDAALGNTTLPANELGQVELNGGTFQAGASFTSQRTVFLGGGSTFDVNGFATSFGSLQDTQRTLAVINSSTTSAGSVTFGTFDISSVATLNVNSGPNTTSGMGTSVTFTNGIIRDPGAALLLQPTTSTLGALAAGTAGSEDVFNGLSSQNTPVNGIVTPWIAVYGATPSNQTPNSPFSFATYGANGYAAASGNSTNILTAGSSSVVVQSTNATLTANTQVYALSVQNAVNVTLGTNTLTIGDGTDPAGLILNGGAKITSGTLAFGGSEGVIWFAGQSTNTNSISAQITGTGGLTFVGGVHATDLSAISKSHGLSVVTISTASTETGPITIDSGAVTLSAANVFANSVSGVLLEDTKSSPSPATLNITASNQFSSLNSVGNNSAVNVSGAGVQLIIGDSNNENSTLSSTITQSTSGVTGALTKNGTGLLDISGASVSFTGTSTVVVNAGELRIGHGVFGSSATTPISVASGAELQYVGNGASVFNDPVSGAGVFHLVTGTVQLTGTNTYTGGTAIEVGATLDTTTANLPSGGAISNAGGTLVFDQNVAGTFTGVMSNGKQSGGPNDPNDVACISVSCSGPTLSGTLIIDDSTNETTPLGSVTLTAVQAYSGMTYVEAGSLTLNAANTIATSAGVDLGRVGGGSNATLILGANNQINDLTSEQGNTTAVQLGSNTLTFAPSGGSFTFSGVISGAGGLTMMGSGTEILAGTNTFTGPTTVSGGTLSVTGSTATSTTTVTSGGTLSGTGTVGTTSVQSGGTLAPGSATAPGTLNVAGNLALASGSNYLDLITPTSAGNILVSGTATISGATFEADAAATSGITFGEHFTAITATGGVSGTFASVTNTLPAYITPVVSYDANDVFVQLNQIFLASELPANAGQNEKNIAGDIDSVVTHGLVPTDGLLSLYGLSGTALNAALNQLSGEIGLDASQAVAQSEAPFMNLLMPSNGNGGAGGGIASISGGPDGVKPAQLQAGGMRVWGSAYGAYSNFGANAGSGAQSLTSNAWGGAAGIETGIDPTSRVGLGVGGGTETFSLAGGGSHGTSGDVMLGVYGSKALPNLGYVAGAVTFGWHDIKTLRNVTAGGTASLLASQFDANDVGGRLEGGFGLGLNEGFQVTPYAAIAGQDFMTPAYSETTVSGSSAFALSYAKRDTDLIHSELGARLGYDFDMSSGDTLSGALHAAWAHQIQDSAAGQVGFQNVAGTSFVVTGAVIPQDSALVGLDLQLKSNSSGFNGGAKVESQFGSGLTAVSGTLSVGYTW